MISKLNPLAEKAMFAESETACLAHVGIGLKSSLEL